MDRGDPGGLRTQFTHVMNVTPAVLEAAGLPEHKIINERPRNTMRSTKQAIATTVARLLALSACACTGRPKPGLKGKWRPSDVELVE